jgi:hypothetical protein
MIFDDFNQPSRGDDSGSPRRRRRRRRSSSSGSAEPHRSGDSPSPRFEEPARERTDGNVVAWLVVLALLVAGVLGFAWYLHGERSASRPLPGEAPSALLVPFVDPILAPLETGTSGYSADTLAAVEAGFRAERGKVNIDDREIYATAATIGQILQEAQADRQRHMERLVKLGAPVEGMAPEPSAPAALNEAERRHLELAVGISWQRNSGTYRNRVEELWYRLLRLEKGRFRTGSAPQAMMPAVPSDGEGGVPAPAPSQTNNP